MIGCGKTKPHLNHSKGNIGCLRSVRNGHDRGPRIEKTTLFINIRVHTASINHRGFFCYFHLRRWRCAFATGSVIFATRTVRRTPVYRCRRSHPKNRYINIRVCTTFSPAAPHARRDLYSCDFCPAPAAFPVRSSVSPLVTFGDPFHDLLFAFFLRTTCFLLISFISSIYVWFCSC